MSNVMMILGYSLGAAVLTALIVWALKKYPVAFEDKFPLVAFAAGFIENILYLASILTDKPEFIFVWLGVKTAIVWYRKVKRERDYNDTQRRAYHTYLFGTGLNLILAYASACLIKGKFIVF